MELIKPSFGLIFWMLIGFGILLFILAKFAWPVITNGIASRNKKIQDQLDEAAKVHDEMVAQAKADRDAILAEARKISAEIQENAKAKADSEARAIIEEAKKAIHFEKMKAMTDVKNEIANLSIDIAEKVMAQELSDKSKQEQLISKWVEENQLN